jgi:anti-sigma B factor antagonist
VAPPDEGIASRRLLPVSTMSGSRNERPSAANQPSKSPPPFDVRLVHERDTVRVVPVGDLDGATVGRLREELASLLDTGSTRLVVDLGELTFMDSSGMHLLLEFQDLAEHDEWEFSVILRTGPARRLLEITGMVDKLDIIDAGDSPQTS